MNFKGKIGYNNYIKNIAIGIVFLFLASIVLSLFSNRALGFTFTLFYAIFALIYLIMRKHIVEVIVEDRIKINYVIFFQHKKKDYGRK
jgi:hypothetical protein